MARGMSSELNRPYDRILKSQRDTRAGTRLGRRLDREAGEESRESAHEVDHRGGRRSHYGGPTYAQLYEEARRRGIKDRSKMTKAQLERAIGRG